MPRAISRTTLQVCSVARNCLAEAYIEQLLRADPRISAFNLKRYVQLSPDLRRNPVFVIDQCGLEIPLGECLRQLRHHSLDARFLVLDEHKSNEEIVRILTLGAHGYVSHTDASGILIDAILSIAANQLWIPREVLPRLVGAINGLLHKDMRARQTTTPREGEILELVRKRLSNREIADLLQIRVSTVKFHLSNILSKMHANNRRELTGPTSQNLWKTQMQ
jgi:NarL family two-component system response regulator LiaR